VVRARYHNASALSFALLVLTAYTPEAIELVPNPAQKYAVASYTPGLQPNVDDGSVSIYMAQQLPAGRADGQLAADTARRIQHNASRLRSRGNGRGQHLRPARHPTTLISATTLLDAAVCFALLLAPKLRGERSSEVVHDAEARSDRRRHLVASASAALAQMRPSAMAAARACKPDGRQFCSDVAPAAEAQAIARATEAGADPATITIIEIEDMPFAYLPGNALRVRVRVAGRWLAENSWTRSDLEQVGNALLDPLFPVAKGGRLLESRCPRSRRKKLNASPNLPCRRVTASVFPRATLAHGYPYSRSSSKEWPHWDLFRRYRGC
jgi:hypothetical protein